MSFQEKKIVVTGAAGFIGSNLTDRLLELGAQVVGVDNLFNGRLDNLEDAMNNKNFKFHKGDIRDLNFLLDICEGASIIYHEAAFASVPQSVKMPENCNDVNVNGIINILNAARRMDVDKVIFASSSSVYGETPGLKKNEEMRRVPISPYGVAKLACEAYMQSFHHVYGLKTTSLRYFNVFGPRQRDDSPYTGVIAIWFNRARGDQNLIVFGDGEQSRDFTYVKDVVQANILAGEKDAPGEIFNIGAGNPISLNNLGKLILKLTGKEHLKLEYTDPRPGDIKHSFADLTKAQKLLGFQPKYDQEQGLREYFNWYVKKFNIDLKIN
ncbi:MAG: SDR family oxidoreductase [Candidatus Hermodarchaeota archaeon]